MPAQNGIEVIIMGLTRNFGGICEFRPLENPLLFPGFQNFKSNTFMFSLLLFSPKDFASQKQAEIYGDVPKRLKGPHSKCGRSAQTDARVRISPSPPPKKPVIKPIMGFFLIPFSKSK